MDLETRVGPASLRTWGLIVNFIANGSLLYGLVGYISDGSRLPLLVVAGLTMLVTIGALSTPSR